MTSDIPSGGERRCVFDPLTAFMEHYPGDGHVERRESAGEAATVEEGVDASQNQQRGARQLAGCDLAGQERHL